MFGQLCIRPDEPPDEPSGLAEVDGEALVDGVGLVSGTGLADGEVAAWATAKVPKPLPNARPIANIAFAIAPCGHARFLIVYSPPPGDGPITPR
jgi:hypothetical protein